MRYISKYKSPLGTIIMAEDNNRLTGLGFENQKYEDKIYLCNDEEQNSTVFDLTRKWLDMYFRGEIPDFTPPLWMVGTDFRLAVWKILKEIPYGHTITYGDIAKKIAEQKGIRTMSAQAIGGAVGHNPISIIVPCHRVVGSHGSLTGYAGGLDKKKKLLEIEGIL